VSLDDIDKLLKRSFHSMRPKRGEYGGAYYYDLGISDNVAIRVYTSVLVRSEMSRGSESKPMSVTLVAPKLKRRLESGKLPIAKRTQNWRTTLLDLIEDKIELYEEKEQYWEGRAGGGAPDPEKGAVEDDDADLDLVVDEAEVGDSPAAEGRLLDEVASWQKCTNGDWGVAVRDPNAKEGDRVQARTQGGDESIVTLAKFDRVQWGKRVFYKGKQEGGRPQRNTYDYRRRY
jgi:hypothetical protein